MIALNRSPNQALSPETARASRTRFFATASPFRQPRRAGFVPCNEQCVWVSPENAERGRR